MERIIELYRERIELMEGARKHLEGNSKQEMDELISEVEGFKAKVEEILEKYEEGAKQEAGDELMEQVKRTSDRDREISKAANRLLKRSRE
ncbi:hypothetical protein AKJ36_00185 [candidate division MSBL1 archaeon SCGC-AAA259I07]|uniref:Uncharacterized protein n=1 Tax=candidate division MSBL1 archaeon SCGC-AAA259I07 TaxID=1698266 RepID=A0A133UMZ2_9EURY|nr:hypothetical protein AKJ36_00185 [candidate division MSBL1 archaeon SCGC-AAA259I07]